MWEDVEDVCLHGAELEGNENTFCSNWTGSKRGHPRELLNT